MSLSGDVDGMTSHAAAEEHPQPQQQPWAPQSDAAADGASGAAEAQQAASEGATEGATLDDRPADTLSDMDSEPRSASSRNSHGGGISPVLSDPSTSSRATSSRRSGVSHLRAAFLQAQTRARLQEEGLAFVYAHVDARVRAAVREVRRAKKKVRKWRAVVEEEERQAAAAAEEQGARERPLLSRSVSDSTSPLLSFDTGSTVPPLSHLGAGLPSAVSPHRDVYLAALATPTTQGSGHTPSATSATSGLHVRSPVLIPSSAPSVTPSRAPVPTSPSMPSLLSLTPAVLAPPLAPSVTEPAAAAPAADVHSDASSSIDGSYCMLPMEATAAQDASASSSSSSGVSGSGSGSGLRMSTSRSSMSVRGSSASLHHSSSHQAMLEAHAALQELRQDSSAPSSPEPLSSLHTSPVGGDLSDASERPFPSLPMLHPVSSPLSAGGFNFGSSSQSHSAKHILATSPYHIAPSTSLPPLRKMSLSRVGSTGTNGSPRMSAREREQVGAIYSPSMHAMQTPRAEGKEKENPAGSIADACASSSGGHGRKAQKPAPSSAAQSLAAALKSLRDAQARFSTLAQFCAPLILRSPQFLRLQEEETLRNLGVLPPSHGPEQLWSDEELTKSAEMQLDAIASQQALERSESETQASRETHDSGRFDERIESASEECKEERKDAPKFDTSSLVIVPSAADMASSPDRARHSGSDTAASSSPLSSTTPPDARRLSKADEREAMQIYIKKLRAEIAAEGEGMGEEQGSHTATAAASADPADSVTLEEALESCVLLHRHLTAERAKLASLEHAAGLRGGSDADSDDDSSSRPRRRARLAALAQDRDALIAQMHALKSVHSEALLKLKNMEAILKKMDVPPNEKGELPHGFKLSKPMSFWSITGLALVFGSLVVVSLGWQRVWVAVRGGMEHIPRLMAGLGFVGGVTASCNATAEVVGTVAASRLQEAATQTAAAVAAEAATQTAQQAASTIGESAATAAAAAAAAPATAAASSAGSYAPSALPWSARSGPFADSGGVLAVQQALQHVSRFPLMRDFFASLSLQFLQIA